MATIAPFHPNHSSYSPSSFNVALYNAWDATIKKIQESPKWPAINQILIGAGLGASICKSCDFLTEKIIKRLGFPPLSDPFNNLSLSYKIAITPIVCIASPVLEELMFRGLFQPLLKDRFQSFYAKIGVPDSSTSFLARVSSVFFGAIIFGTVHFTNAIPFWCNPILLLPQVVGATIAGIALGLGKEWSEGLFVPIGMHIGFNIFGWAEYINESLSPK